MPSRGSTLGERPGSNGVLGLAHTNSYKLAIKFWGVSYYVKPNYVNLYLNKLHDNKDKHYSTSLKPIILVHLY